MQIPKLLLIGLGAVCLGSAGFTAASEQAEQLARNALALDANAQRGARLFRAECAGCHGRAAHGDSARLVPALAGQRRAYLVKQLADFASSERVTTAMHAVVMRTRVSAPQAWADVALHLNGASVLKAPKAGPGTGLAAGQAAYERWCAACHEDDARGDDDGFVPSLRNQHYSYLLEEMLSIRAGHRPSLEPQLAAIMAESSPQELAAIADYVARLRGPVRDRTRLRDDGSLSD